MLDAPLLALKFEFRSQSLTVEKHLAWISSESPGRIIPHNCRSGNGKQRNKCQ
jgi:hypothetical protein